MIFDTDIFIWTERDNKKAAKLMEKAEEKYLSIQTYMKLLQCAKNKTQHKHVKDFLTSLGFIVLPLTENIGHRASIYVEEYTLSSNLRAGNAIVAAADRKKRGHFHYVFTQLKKFKNPGHDRIVVPRIFPRLLCGCNNRVFIFKL